MVNTNGQMVGTGLDFGAENHAFGQILREHYQPELEKATHDFLDKANGVVDNFRKLATFIPKVGNNLGKNGKLSLTIKNRENNTQELVEMDHRRHHVGRLLTSREYDKYTKRPRQVNKELKELLTGSGELSLFELLEFLRLNSSESIIHFEKRTIGPEDSKCNHQNLNLIYSPRGDGFMIESYGNNNVGRLHLDNSFNILPPSMHTTISGLEDLQTAVDNWNDPTEEQMKKMSIQEYKDRENGLIIKKSKHKDDYRAYTPEELWKRAIQLSTQGISFVTKHHKNMANDLRKMNSDIFKFACNLGLEKQFRYGVDSFIDLRDQRAQAQ